MSQFTPTRAGVHQRTCHAVQVSAKAAASVGSNGSVALSGGPSWRKLPQQWVVFSDLHVNLDTAAVCMKVLERVDAEAHRRDAGVIFLGDFWHKRGVLPVPPLNAVVDAFAAWRHPTLMLVGNHDQVTLSGEQHALKPIAATSKRMHVFDRPATFMNALWLPYRRDAAVLSDAIAAAGSVNAIFAHVDIIGAQMNDTYQSRDGMDASLFPSDVPVYTGHYHKPHVVAGTRIHYVGSPYQVSRSEAGQSKELIVLDASKRWSVCDRVPIDVGPRHFILDSAARAVDLLSQVDNSDDGGDGNGARALQRNDVAVLRIGDDLSEADAKQLQATLEAQGVVVEVVTQPEGFMARITDVPEHNVVAFFDAYACKADMPSDARCVALQLLQEGDQHLEQRNAAIQFHEVEMEGYGPFCERVVYQLNGCGLRVVSGQNEDDGGADSNGAGKSALVMAPFFALTGSLGARSDFGDKKGVVMKEVVNDGSKAARVKLTGTLNGKAFEVQRVVRASGRGNALKLTLDGEDVTAADIRMTQAIIDQEFGTHLLLRGVFHTQSSASSLLEGNDKDFKDELGKLVSLAAWQAAKDRAAERLKAADEGVKKLNTQHESTMRNIESLQTSLQTKQHECDTWQQRAQQEQQAKAATLQTHVRQLTEAVESLQQSTAQLRALQHAVEHSESSSAASPSTASPADEFARDVDNKERALQSLRTQHTALTERSAALRSAAKLHKQRLDKHAALQHSHTDEEGGGADWRCDRCLQPIDEQLYNDTLRTLQHEYDDAAQQAQHASAELTSMTQTLQSSQRALDAVRLEWQKAVSAAQRAAAAQQQAAKDIARRVREIASAVASCSDTLEAAQQLLRQHGVEHSTTVGDVAVHDSDVANASTSAANVVSMCKRALQQRSAVQSAVASVQRSMAEANQLQLATNPYTAQVQQLNALIEQQQTAACETAAALSLKQAQLELLKHVDAAFSRSGVQSFALENVLAALQQHATHYLQQLAPSWQLLLSATNANATSSSVSALEKITKLVSIRLPNGDVRTRSLAQLSSGERRRVSLALALAFAALLRQRGRLRCNVIVLDEVLANMDNEGCAALAAVLRALPHDSVLVVGQANTFLTEEFDAVDVVVKANGCSTVQQLPVLQHSTAVAH